MTEIRKFIGKDEKEVFAYTLEEAANLAARTMCVSDTDLGVFCQGYIAGMAMADDKKFDKAPVDSRVAAEVGYACIAQGAAVVMDDYERLKRDVLTIELKHDSAWLDTKKRFISKLIADGKEIALRINEFLKGKVDEAAEKVEDVIIETLRDEFEKEKKDGR